MLLNRIISEMHEHILWILEYKFIWGCSNVPLFIPIGFKVSVDTGNDHEVANIKLSLLIEERPVNVSLNNEGSKASIHILFSAFESNHDVIQAMADWNPSSLVWVLAWFDYPDVMGRFPLFFLLFYFVEHLKEFFKLGVLHAPTDMKCHWDHWGEI